MVKIVMLFLTLFFYHHTYSASIQIATIQSLSFGSFAAGGGGNVVMSPAGVRTNTGTITLLQSDPGTPAQFSVTSSPNNRNFDITFSGSVYLYLIGLGAPMQLSSLISTPNSQTANTGTSGTVLSVGGTLSVANNQTPGSYIGYFSVTVDFD